MSTENIIRDLLDGNISDAKSETENLLYAKVDEILNDVTDEVSASVYGISEKKKKKGDKDDDYAEKTDKEDDGEGLDPVDAEDSDVDNDGDEDESDEYLKNRRKVRKKEIEDEEEVEEAVAETSQGPVHHHATVGGTISSKILAGRKKKVKPV